MPSAYEGLVERLREHLHESQGPGLGLGLPEASTGAAACRDDIDDAVSYIVLLEAKLKRRDETIRELRRTVMLELLTLQTKGVKDETSRHAIQKKTIDRLQQDEVHLTESRQKVSNLENEVNVLKRQLVDYRTSCDAEKLLLRQQLDEMDFNNTELKERVKIVDADSKLLKIVMIGKDAIVEKQYGQLQEKDLQIENLEGQVSSAASENSKSSTIIKSLREEIDEMKLNNEKNHLLERVQLLNSENLAVKKSLAEYKDGYGKLSEQCKGLTEELKKNKEMVEHLKSFRRKSKISLTACPTIEEGNTEPMASTAGDLTVKNDRCDQQGTGDHATGKRRNSSRMSIRRKSTAPSNPSSRDHSTENVSASQFTCTEEKGESLTRIQLRRLRTGSVVHPDFSPQSKLTEEKECQVNIDSSKYANVRMGNEEEVVVKALYRRIAELESLSQSQQSEIEQLNLEKSGDDVLAKRKRVPATQLPCTEQDLSDYQMQSFETFLSLKADGVNLRLNVDELKNKLRSLEEYCATLQASPSLLECKATQCDTENFVANASIQASVLAKDYSTQTSQPTPLSNNQYIEDSFYSYIFKELLDVCKHVVATNRPSGSALGGEEGILSQTLSSCKNLISSLVVLRKDLFEEMQYRGGEFNTVRSRSFLRCIEVVIRAFDKIINCQHHGEFLNDDLDEPDDEIGANYPSGLRESVKVNSDPESFSDGLMLTPITLHMTKFKHDIPVYDYDYELNRVIFSRVETPAVLPSADQFGGGAPAGSLAKPQYTAKRDAKAIKHCATQDINKMSETNWVIPRVNDSYCDSFVESANPHTKDIAPSRPSTSTGAHHNGNDISQDGEHGCDKKNIPAVNVSPVKISHNSSPKKYHKRGYSSPPRYYTDTEEYFSISRPLCAQNDRKSKPSPRHIVLIEKRKGKK